MQKNSEREIKIHFKTQQTQHKRYFQTARRRLQRWGGGWRLLGKHPGLSHGCECAPTAGGRRAPPAAAMWQQHLSFQFGDLSDSRRKLTFDLLSDQSQEALIREQPAVLEPSISVRTSRLRPRDKNTFYSDFISSKLVVWTLRLRKPRPDMKISSSSSSSPPSPPPRSSYPSPRVGVMMAEL